MYKTGRVSGRFDNDYNIAHRILHGYTLCKIFKAEDIKH